MSEGDMKKKRLRKSMSVGETKQESVKDSGRTSKTLI